MKPAYALALLVSLPLLQCSAEPPEEVDATGSDRGSESTDTSGSTTTGGGWTVTGWGTDPTPGSSMGESTTTAGDSGQATNEDASSDSESSDEHDSTDQSSTTNDSESEDNETEDEGAETGSEDNTETGGDEDCGMQGCAHGGTCLDGLCNCVLGFDPRDNCETCLAPKIEVNDRCVPDRCLDDPCHINAGHGQSCEVTGSEQGDFNCQCLGDFRPDSGCLECPTGLLPGPDHSCVEPGVLCSGVSCGTAAHCQPDSGDCACNDPEAFMDGLGNCQNPCDGDPCHIGDGGFGATCTATSLLDYTCTCLGDHTQGSNCLECPSGMVEDENGHCRCEVECELGDFSCNRGGLYVRCVRINSAECNSWSRGTGCQERLEVCPWGEHECQPPVLCQNPCDFEGERRCVADRQQVCVERGGCRDWVEHGLCEENGPCSDPEETQFEDGDLERRIRKALGDTSPGRLAGQTSFSFGPVDFHGGLQCFTGLIEAEVTPWHPLGTIHTSGWEQLEVLTIANDPEEPTQPGVVLDLSQLAALEKLEDLRLQDVDFRYLESSALLRRLEKLTLHDVRRHELSRLGNFKNLRQLTIDETSVGQLEELAGLDTLEALTLRNEAARTLAVPGTLPALEYIWIEDTPIEDISGLSGHSSLDLLFIHRSQISSLATLRDIPTLTKLRVQGSSLTELGELEGTRNLTIFDISDNQLQDISVIEHLPKLMQLNISGNPIEDLRPVTTLPNLSTLDANNLGLESLAPLCTVASLRRLRMQGNKIASLSDLSKCGAVEYFDLRDNLITDLSAFVGREGVKEINIEGNPIDCDAQSAVLRELRADRVRVLPHTCM